MQTYIALLNWTQDGVQNIKDSPKRLAKAKAAAKAAGAKLKTFYMTMGQYDMVAVIEAPDEATYARVMLGIAAAGGTRTQTLRAFTEEEYKAIVESL